MCGIFGGLSLSGKSIDKAIVEKMSQQVARRGPDDRGEFYDGPVMLGHRRLAIIDLSEKGHQPMTDVQQNLTIVFNGTIYNYPELREILMQKGCKFQSHSDTEVILNAYAHWGAACVEKLHGMFAFAIWDKRTQKLFLARDRMGIKPLYYLKTDHFFFFASNPQALLKTGVCDTSIDPVSLHHLFTLHAVVPAPGTLFNGVKKCPPAHTMLLDKSGQLKISRYWQLTAKRPEIPRTDSEWQEAIHQSLLQAVKKRLT
ncbi:MAG: N-acetylglutaminylglutamine amidotransferase, partial [Gammaproteobacteria bacterium]|nr:N-acetylglutaminylglutamine amidotransferase [Gammaproteobacteria bacterium]